MPKRTLALLALLCTAFTPSLLFSSAMADAAAPRAAVASPKCSGTLSHGKIRYQVCFRWNCDSTKCNVLGYLGLINTATSARTVKWELDYGIDGGPYNDDSDGTAVLAAGEQRTIYPAAGRQTRLCVRNEENLQISYDSTGWSIAAITSETIGCL
ncbi:hypothetical protein QRX60_28330 [Amycolatopsis mongoliensis]|uniref:Secreted protein n=1 Tax=Amycolatopsis mongoliensis TaxID=715475 RepID=A0A9Y2JIM7_9PSEU|nr:hypothetical protein [Amycolatopsis sp. 4-36]WIX97983.1 hypothetical protein QRX60_28330 [Amycolatopsis sp. 4-36]